MPNPITISVKLDGREAQQASQQIGRDLNNALDAGVRGAQTAGRQIGDALSSGLESARRKIRELGSALSEVGGKLSLGLTAPITALGAAAAKSAVDIDRQINVLKSLTGSAAAAEARYAALVAVAQKTPGLTANLAATLDAQLRVASVTEQTINRILPAIGKLNAVSPLGNPQQFAQNLIQLVTQGFERADLKELVGQSPLAGEILKNIFNVDSPTNSEAIRAAAKKLGIVTAEQFFEAFAAATNNNPKLANVTESLGTQFDKLKDRVLVALRPLGLEIINALAPLVEKAIPIIEQLSRAFADLSPNTRQAIVVAAGLAAALGPVLLIAGQLAGAVSGLIGLFGTLSTSGVGLAGVLTTGLNPALVGIAALLTAGAVLWFEYGRAAEKGVAAIDAAVKRANGGFDQLNSRTLNIGGQQVVIPKDLSGNEIKPGLDLPRDPRFSNRRFVNPFSGAAVQTDELGRPLNPNDSNIVRDRFSSLGRRPSAIAGASANSGAGGETESRERQVRQALLAQQRELLEQNNSLLEDANRRELENFRALLDDKKISLREFYDTKLGLDQANLGNAINLLQREIQAVELSAAAARAGTPEKIRLETELFKLRTDLTIKTRELTDAETRNQREFLEKSLIERQRLLKETQQLALGIDGLPSNSIKSGRTAEEESARAKVLAAQRASLEFSRQDGALRLEELRIQNLVTAGVLNEAQGREAILAVQQQFRDVLIQSLEIQKLAESDPLKLQQLQAQIEQLRTLGLNLSPVEAFFKGLRSQSETLSESFERIGTAFKDRILGTLDAGIDRLTAKFGFFKDLLGDILKSLTRNVLARLFGAGGGASFGGAQAGGGGFGVGNILGGLLGGGRPGGGFLTPSFNPNASGNPFIALGGLLGGGITAPASSSGLGGLPSAPGPFPVPLLTPPGARPGVGSIAGLFGGLGNLFQGFGFGLKPGSPLGGLAAAAPLLGLTLGAGLGTDRLTSILGGVGGGLLGVGLTAAPAALAGGPLAFLGHLFSNPITAVIGAALLPAAFLLGRARQRRRDERTSGDFLQQAIDAIRDLKKQIESDQLIGTVAQIRRQFEQDVIGTFVQQINTLKTKSVRQSRLTNQVRDLRALFDKEVVPAIEAQKRRGEVSRRLIPEFAIGGIVPGFPTPGRDSVLSFLSPGEMVLTVRHQQQIAAMAGGDVFARAGVPGAGRASENGGQAFAFGGIVRPSAPVAQSINLTVQLVVGSDDANQILSAAASTDEGQQVLVNAQRAASRNRLR